MDARLTCCPACSTTFRVSPQQLTIANGAVRCGACMHIFQAQEHWREEEDHADEELIHDDPSQDRTAPSLISSGDHVFSEDILADRQWGNPDQFFEDLERERPNDQEEEDDSWAMQLLDELDSSDTASHSTSKPALSSAESEFFLPDQVEPVHKIGHHEHTEPQTVEPNSVAPVATSLDQINAADDASFELPLEAWPKDLVEPITLDWHADQPWWQRAMWPALSLLALAALTVQLYQMNFHTLAMSPASRPLLHSWCKLSGCQLPAQEDLARIRIDHLLVRSHPKHPEVLTVDLLLNNTAPFPQPFPDLYLRFLDPQGETIGQRRIEPARYLSGELAGATRLPSDQPVHIQLLLQDPGARADNYLLDLLPPRQN